MYKLLISVKYFSPNIINLVYLIVLISSLILCTVTGEPNIEEAQTNKQPINRLLVMTIANNPNDERFQRFNRSVEAFDLDLTVLSTQDKRGDKTEITRKLDLFRKALAIHKNEQDLVVMLVDSSNLIVNGNKNDILSRLEKFNPKTKIVFSAESRCRPDPQLASKYPKNTLEGDRFLSSEALIGYAPALWELLNLSNEIEQTQAKVDEDFQLYCTQNYLDSNIRQKLAIELDHKAELFQNLHSSEGSVEVELNLDSVKLKNRAYGTEPVVVYGDGSSKVRGTTFFQVRY